ncbi:MAG: insulinase family protein [Oscillospiraceae bacterium]|nr:insulinase family protein [Oscillospiraceae bacterium]
MDKMDTVELIENQKIDEKYYYLKHESGLDIYIIPKNHTSSYAIFAAKYGSVDSIFRKNSEPEFTVVPDGIAHFLEHKLFESEDGIDAFKKYAETGANANAYTSFDKTCYLFSCSDNGENFDKSLEILLDFVTHPYFTDATVQKEQGIIGQEIRMYDDNPGWQVYFQMLANMYEKHSVRVDIAGTVESISKITADILYKCYNTFYNLNNMVLCITGNISPDQVKNAADKILKNAGQIDIERFNYNEPQGVRKNITEKKLKVSKPLFNIGIKDGETGLFGRDLAKKEEELDILNNMMFGKSSDFYTRLYDGGKINNKFGAGSEVEVEYCHMLYSGESDNPQEIMDEIIKEYESKIANGLDREDFDRCKRLHYANSITIFDSTDDISNVFVNCIFKGYNLLDLPEIIGSITFEDIEKRLIKIFKKENFLISIVNPID